MKQFLRMVAMVLCISLLLPTLGGCGMFGGYEEPEPFDPPYLENYYVNKHEPVCVIGGIDVYEYDEDAEALWMGGYPYHGGFEFRGSTDLRLKTTQCCRKEILPK